MRHFKCREDDDSNTESEDPLGDEYKMDHSNRGRAIIFNHVHCDGHIAPRRGTEKDVERLEYTLTTYLKFEVIVYTDFTYDQIMNTLQRCENFLYKILFSLIMDL